VRIASLAASRAALAATAALACLGAAACGSASGSSTMHTSSDPSSPVTGLASSSSSAPTATPRPTPTVPPRVHALSVVSEIAKHEPSGAVSVAAQNLDTGARFVAGRRSGMWTASAYKLFVLEALLWERGGPLSGYEEDVAERAIENSDNPSGYSLFLAAGGNSGLESAAHRFGMRHTIPGVSDPTFTRTSAADFLILARNLVSKHSPLTPAARKYALALMADVESDQRWGVSAAADKGSDFYNKNGWLSVDDSNGPGESDGGRWAVTSVGIIQVHHHTVLMAVFTQHQPDFETGVHLVERLAKTIAPAVAD
jgi:hypothetical protein